MYFESRPHRLIHIASSREAVERIQSRQASTLNCLCWRNPQGQRLALVDDSHIDDSFGEVALVNLDTKEQYESITFAWCKHGDALQLVERSMDGHHIFRRNVIVPLDGADENHQTHFTCGCCGENFLSTIAEQKPFDQDASFGICPACAPRY